MAAQEIIKRKIITPLPSSAYIEGHAPYRNDLNQLVYESAPAIKYGYMSQMWDRRNREINKHIDRSNAQVIVLPAHNDTSKIILKSLTEKPIGKYPVANHIETTYPDKEIYLRSIGIDLKADSYYLVGSLLDSEDFNRARAIADYCKRQNPRCIITMVCPSIGKARQDKNVNSETKIFEPKTLNIATEMKASALLFDRMIVVEPHSSATQAYAAEVRIPLLPVSPWKILTDHLLKVGVRDPKNPEKRIPLTRENTIVIRPDEGRNIAATRIQEYTGFGSVSFEKTRNGGAKSTVKDLSEADRQLVKGKIAIMYDDEASTLSTMETIGDKLSLYGMLAIGFMVAYGKFVPGYWDKTEKPAKYQKGWRERINHPLLSTIIRSDAREPVGKIGKIKKIETVSLDNMLRDIIEADIKGINFWKDSQFKEAVLQED